MNIKKITVWQFLALVYRPSKNRWPSRKIVWLLFWILPLAQKHSNSANFLPCDKAWYNPLVRCVISGPSLSLIHRNMSCYRSWSRESYTKSICNVVTQVSSLKIASFRFLPIRLESTVTVMNCWFKK